MNHKAWLIIANGEPLADHITKGFSANRHLIALDGALKQCLASGIVPNICIGDFDSLDPAIIDKSRSEYDIQFIRNPCQNSTDLEKALNYLHTIAADDILICHATGWRLDHTLYNLRLLKRFHQKFKSISLITENEKTFFIKNQNIKLSGPKNEAVALLSFPKAIINSKGLKYDMEDYLLDHGFSESTSNALEKGVAYINIQGEVLLILSHDISIDYLKA